MGNLNYTDGSNALDFNVNDVEGFIKGIDFITKSKEASNCKNIDELISKLNFTGEAPVRDLAITNVKRAYKNFVGYNVAPDAYDPYKREVDILIGNADTWNDYNWKKHLYNVDVEEDRTILTRYHDKSWLFKTHSQTIVVQPVSSSELFYMELSTNEIIPDDKLKDISLAVVDAYRLYETERDVLIKYSVPGYKDFRDIGLTPYTNRVANGKLLEKYAASINYFDEIFDFWKGDFFSSCGKIMICESCGRLINTFIGNMIKEDGEEVFATECCGTWYNSDGYQVTPDEDVEEDEDDE